jgi:hypothetical protein
MNCFPENLSKTARRQTKKTRKISNGGQIFSSFKIIKDENRLKFILTMNLKLYLLKL